MVAMAVVGDPVLVTRGGVVCIQSAGTAVGIEVSNLSIAAEKPAAPPQKKKKKLHYEGRSSLPTKSRFSL